MGFLDDQMLVQQIRSGDEQAFVTLIRRYERSLSALIRDRIGSVDAVEDVLQETLVHAWSGLRKRAPRHVRAWLYQVARNRCADYMRSAHRREQFVESEDLATMINRFGVPAARQRRAAKEVVDAFDHLPAKERAALRSFYLDGLSIAEIAARHRCPTGNHQAAVVPRQGHGSERTGRHHEQKEHGHERTKQNGKRGLPGSQARHIHRKKHWYPFLHRFPGACLVVHRSRNR